MVIPDISKPARVRWVAVTLRKDGAETRVVSVTKRKNETPQVFGTLQSDNRVMRGNIVCGRYQPAGLLPEVAAWYYTQVAEIWTLDNEFAARWASYAFTQDHRDLKVVLAAFMLVQSRRGDIIRNDGTSFRDADYREIGEAMLLLPGEHNMNPRMILRVQALLKLPEIAAINRALGFGRSLQRPFYGRWASTVAKWLAYREDNPKLLQGLVKAGFRTSVQALVQRAAHVGGGWKPSGPMFYDLLRWPQVQAPAGHRTLNIGTAVREAASWAGLSEAEICQRIEAERPNWKRIVGLLPSSVGVTRAVVVAALQAGSLSDKDLVILTPTLEELGLLEVPVVKARWTAATQAASDMRALNIAKNVKQQETKAALHASADKAVQTAVEKVARGVRVYVIIDISGSMRTSIERAKSLLVKFVPAFPPDRLHVAVFNTYGREVKIPHPSAAGVEQALRGITVSGGTSYGAGVLALEHYKPSADEDALFIFVGDEANDGSFAPMLRAMNMVPAAFGLIHIQDPGYASAADVRDTASDLGIPCFEIDEAAFDDVYAIPRLLRTLMDATPVTRRGYQASPAVRRQSLVDTILKTPLLTKPTWA